MTGTIGILIKAKKLGLIGEVLPLIDELKKKGIWISQTLRDRIKTIVEE